MKSKRIYVALIFICAFIMPLINSVSAHQTSNINAKEVVFEIETDNTQIEADITRLIFVSAKITVQITTNLSQEILIQYIIPITGEYRAKSMAEMPIEPGVHEFSKTVTLNLFNPLGHSSAYVAVNRVNENGDKTLLFVEFMSVQVASNPLLNMNFALLFFVGLGYLIFKKEKLRFIPHSTRKYLESSKITTEKLHGIGLYRKIICPECHRRIIEGSAYCCFCGYHLALFERFLR